MRGKKAKLRKEKELQSAIQKREKIYGRIFLIGCGLAIAAMVGWAKISNHILVNEIKANRTYAIATMTKYKPARPIRQGTSSEINFIDSKGEFVTITNPSGVKSDLVNPIGWQFLVIYDSTNVENCILLVDYSVEDSLDFKRYMIEFEKHPPTLKP